jgi:GNAT superfamily N-acetyltransferase
MNTSEVLNRLDQERQTLWPDQAVAETLPGLTRVYYPERNHHQIEFSALDPGTAERRIQEQLAHYRALGVAFEWTVYEHDRPSHLLNLLEDLGFQIGPREAVMVREVGSAAGWAEPAAPLRVARVQSAADVAVYQALEAEVFAGTGDGTARELLRAIATPNASPSGYIGFVGDEAAAIGRLQTTPGSQFGGLYGAGTREGWRGQGLYRALVAARAREAAARGLRYLRVDALPTSRPILERLGFERVTASWPCVSP